MWLLSTDRAELKFFISPEDVPGGYAILSHVWGEHEDTFQYVRSLSDRCTKTGENPRDLVGIKIRESCRLAQRHGWAWIWSDTCCIDKSSSAELSEAINSMFRYYSLSAVCYAFLGDVPPRSSLQLDDDKSHFRHSRWHKRGWTLQELVAPKLVIFVSSEWTILGHKAALAELLESITRVPVGILRFEKDITDVSLAGRMSWASDRQTTRAEDEAYSLMGIFGINMPTLYGEGRKAFYRLQEEIMRTSVDTSLFVWGRSQAVGALSSDVLRAESPIQHGHFSDVVHLLAPSPSLFITGDVVEFNVVAGVGHMGVWQPQKDEAHEERTRVPILTTTPYGVRAKFPIIEFAKFSIAVLCCTFDEVPVGLALSKCPDGRDPERPLYHCDVLGCRLVLMSSVAQRDLFPTWKTVYITAQPPFRADPSDALLPGRSLYRSLAYTHTTTTTPFRIPVTALNVGSLFRCISVFPETLPTTWAGNPPLMLVYQYRSDYYELTNALSLTLGVCHHNAPGSAGNVTEHWAVVKQNIALNQDTHPLDTHTCALDHIAAWPNRTKFLRRVLGADGAVNVMMTFAVCPMNEIGGTLVLQLWAS